MSASSKYAATGVAVVAVSTACLWPFLDDAGRRGVLFAAGITLVVQVVAFTALYHFRGALNGFLAAWVGGTLVRMGVIAVAAFAVIRSGMPGGAPMLLALAGFFFGLLLLEPFFFRLDPNTTVEA